MSKLKIGSVYKSPLNYMDDEIIQLTKIVDRWFHYDVISSPLSPRYSNCFAESSGIARDLVELPAYDTPLYKALNS